MADTAEGTAALLDQLQNQVNRVVCEIAEPPLNDGL